MTSQPANPAAGPLPEILTLDEAAVYLRKSVKCLRRMANRHRFPAVRIGREWRVKRDELDAFLRSGFSAPTATPTA